LYPLGLQSEPRKQQEEEKELILPSFSFLPFSLASLSTLKIEAMRPFETSVSRLHGLISKDTSLFKLILI
jgi:hypothetical protein